MASPVRFTAVRKQLEKAGWSLDRVNGSHHVFSRPGSPTVSIPVHGGKVKARYARIVQKLIDEEGQ